MSEASLVQCEETQDYTPVADTSAGKVVRLADGRAAVIACGILANAMGAAYVEGIFDATAGSSVVFDIGEDAFWDVSAATAINAKDADVGDFPLGIAIAAKASGALVVRVDLNAVSMRAQLLYALLAAGTALTTSSAEAVMATYSIPATGLKPGAVLAVLAQVIATATNLTDTFQFRLRLGGLAGSVIADTGAIDLADNDTGILKAEIVVRDTGATGHVVAAGETRLKTTNAHTVLGSTAFDMTAAITVVLTGQISSANAGNSCRADLFNVNRR